MFASNCEELQSERVMREFLHHLLPFSGAVESCGGVPVATLADRLFLACFITLFFFLSNLRALVILSCPNDKKKKKTRERKAKQRVNM